MRRSWILLGVLILGCNGTNSPIARAAGSWPGQFKIETVDGQSDAKSILAEEMKGNLELYVSHDKFRLDMATRNQQFTVQGKWTAEKNRVTLTADNYVFDNPTEDDQKARGLKIISPDSIRAEFGHPVVLDESADKRHLTGLKTSLGRLIGNFQFERPIPH